VDAEAGLLAKPTKTKSPCGTGTPLARLITVLPCVPQVTDMSAYELSANPMANVPATTYLIVLFMCLSLSLFYSSLTGPVSPSALLFIGSIQFSLD
jgi:hypothetical protein